MQKRLIALGAAVLLLGGCQEKERQQEKAQVQKEQKQQQQEQSAQPKQEETALQQEQSAVTQTPKTPQQQPVEESGAAMEKDGVAAKQKNTKQQEPPTSAEKNGQELYVSCVSCHGPSAQRKALGTSEVIAGWDKQKLIDAMQGYKDGTYGGNMKATMAAQMGRFDKAQIEKMAEYISGL
jgi:cytochrome c553